MATQVTQLTEAALHLVAVDGDRVPQERLRAAPRIDAPSLNPSEDGRPSSAELRKLFDERHRDQAIRLL